MKRLLAVMALVFVSTTVFAAVFATTASADHDIRCYNCRMKTSPDSRFNMVFTFSDGSTVTECSLYCASMEHERIGTKIEQVEAYDYNTGEKIDARSAVWVEGSDEKPVMGTLSRIAFKDGESAAEYIKEHGGWQVSFEQAYENSVKEWKEQ